MDQAFQSYLSKHLPEIPFKSAAAILELAAEGATVPFIARYRKEKTGNMDEVQVRDVIEANETFGEIVKRRAFLIKEIGSQGNLTDKLEARIKVADSLNELEEIYRPYKKKKKTKATLAREAGLEPLADWLWQHGRGELQDETTPEVKAKEFLNVKAGYVTYDHALKGASDILIEKIANDPDLRSQVRANYFDVGTIFSKSTKNFKDKSKYDMYVDFNEPVKSLMDQKHSHRYLAMRRGWQEGELAIDLKGSEEELQQKYEAFATSVKGTPTSDLLRDAAKTALSVYVIPSVTNEVHKALKEKADQDAIEVFAQNARKLLLASPYGSRCVLGVDPGLKTGCKVALVDKGGHFISHTVMQILGDNAEEKAKKLFQEVFKQIKIDAVAVGNGTAGREAEVFLRKIVKDLGYDTPVVMVNESGASVYSASDVAREEFPDLDLTVRGAISIARRMQDPLAELVKIDPKSIGVGQYQHDVSQSQLKKSLGAVVESCVNAVGVDLNTASTSLLSYVSGIGPALAKNIVEHRKSKGLFKERSELMEVGRFSGKVFEQSAGFLRVLDGRVSLDKTGVHPERYSAVKDMAKELGVSVSDLMGEGARKLVPLREKWAKLIGEFTFDDIVAELEKPGRDPRDAYKVFQFRDDIFMVKDLQEGMICPGVVTNVTNFGAFVDVGVHQDGLVHISELSHNFVDDPRKVVSPGDHVKVKVLSVDQAKNQISFSMKLDAAPAKREKSDSKQKAQGRGKPRGAAGGKGSRKGPGKPGGGKPSGQPQRRPSQPFNNPFAALVGINSDKG